MITVSKNVLCHSQILQRRVSSSAKPHRQPSHSNFRKVFVILRPEVDFWLLRTLWVNALVCFIGIQNVGHNDESHCDYNVEVRWIAIT